MLIVKDQMSKLKNEIMKKTGVLVILILAAMSNLTQAQSLIQQDKILGEWLNGDETGIIEIPWLWRL